jgi:hypothetical protein
MRSAAWVAYPLLGLEPQVGDSLGAGFPRGQPATDKIPREVRSVRFETEHQLRKEQQARIGGHRVCRSCFEMKSCGDRGHLETNGRRDVLTNRHA